MAKARGKGRPADAAGKRTTAPAPRQRLAPDWKVVGLALFGMLLTGYLSAVALWGTLPLLCDGESGCASVQQSRWSVFLGLPIALWGFALYALIAAIAAAPGTRLKRWRRLWPLSLIGLAISVYLTVVGLVALQAVCLWCLLSLLTMAAIFVLVHVGRPPSAPGTRWQAWLTNNGAAALVIVVLMQLYYAGLFAPAESPRLQALAEHLERTGAVYYGADWCVVCQQQNRLFGASAKRLPYVECHPSGRTGPVALECVNAGVRSFPTWVIRGRQHNQLLQPEELARLSGFNWQGFEGE